MSAHTLSKCPFCGTAAYTQRRDINGRMPAPPETLPGTWFVCCENEETCGAEVGRFHSEEEAVAAWERRMAKATHEVLARIQSLAFDLLKEAEEFRTGEHVPPDKWDAMKSLVNEKRRVATQLNDIIEEDGQS